MSKVKFHNRVFETEKELNAYHLGYDDALDDAEGYTDADIEQAENEGYDRGFKEANELREEWLEDNKVRKIFAEKLGLSGQHWEYIISQAFRGDLSAVKTIMIELEKKP